MSEREIWRAESTAIFLEGVDEGFIATCYEEDNGRKRAEQIVKEHNLHPVLVEACEKSEEIRELQLVKAMLKVQGDDDGVSQTQTAIEERYRLIRSALEQAKGE